MNAERSERKRTQKNNGSKNNNDEPWTKISCSWYTWFGTIYSIFSLQFSIQISIKYLKNITKNVLKSTKIQLNGNRSRRTNRNIISKIKGIYCVWTHSLLFYLFVESVSIPLNSLFCYLLICIQNNCRSQSNCLFLLSLKKSNKFYGWSQKERGRVKNGKRHHIFTQLDQCLLVND